jgi:hypothetical protein
MASTYHVTESTVNSAVPVSGRFLAHNHYGKVVRAFFGGDLVAGDKWLANPTISQAARLVGVCPTYVQWALLRQSQHREIIRGIIPLVPGQHVAPKTNGTAAPVTLVPSPPESPASKIDDGDIIKFVRAVGVSRVLEAAVAVEAAQ